MPLLDLQKLPHILKCPPWLQNKKEIDITMGLLFGKRDVGLQTETDGCDDGRDFFSDGFVFCWGQRLCVLECVSSHRWYFFYNIITKQCADQN